MRVSIDVQNVETRAILEEIENQTEYLFVYNPSDVNLGRKTSLKATNETVANVLTTVFENTDVGYAMEGSNIFLMKKNSDESVGNMQQDDLKISGTVSDRNGESVIGASVIIKGTTRGAVTDLDGRFSMSVPDNVTLEVSCIGYLTQEVIVRGNTSFRIVLEEEAQKLDEVVVIGYGTRSRKSITGSVDQVRDDVFKDRPVSNAMQALQGASANLIIQQTGSNPNSSGMNINIRGVSTMGNNDPLIVIDGLTSSTETLNNMNPNDIASVSVLKDAGSAAIYGSRSANGVILVTTKKGQKSGKPVVSFSGQVGWQDPDILYQPVEGWQNAMYRNTANMNVGSSPQFTAAEIRDLYEHRDEEYWFYNEIMESALQQNYNMNVSGGSENVTYMVSAGYFKQESNFVGNYGVERYNFRSNISAEYGRFKLTALMGYNRRKERTIAGGTGNVIINSSRIPPYYYYKFQEDGKYLVNDVVGDDNTLATLLDGGHEDKDQDNFIGSMNADLKIIDGLKLSGMIGLDLTQHHRFRRDEKVPLYSSSDLENPVLYKHSDTEVEDYNSKYYTLSTQILLDFDRTFNDKHHVSAMFGATNESYTFEASRIAWLYTDEDLGLPTTDDAIQDTGNYNSNSDTDETSITSILGRVGYSFKDKYYADFSFRYDGSSKFAKEHRWGFFPSFSAAWRLSEENFMGQYKSKVGDLKIRASYGVLGNQNVDNYSYQTTYTMYNYTYAFNNSSVAGTGYTVGNSELTWEKSGTLNVGLDATFLKGSLSVSFDYFNQKTWDILLSPEVASIYGTSTAKENMGEMRNQGWEATINYNLKTGSFYHNFNFNIADSKNKVTDFGGEERISSSDQLYSIIREGVALGSYYGYKTDGLFQSYEEIENSAIPTGYTVQPGDVKYVDQNGDGVIDSDDRVVLGNAFPRYTFGFTYNLQWKGFDLSIMLQGVGKRSMYVRGELIEPFHSNYSYCIYQHQLDFWTPTNTDARWPRLVAPSSSSSTNNWSMNGSDIYLLNAAYLRVKNIQVGYTLPQSFTQKFGVQKLRISFNTQNPFTFCKNSFVDPESTEYGNNMGGTGGVSANSARNYPTLKYYGFGFELEF